MSAIAGIISDLPRSTISNILARMNNALADFHHLGSSDMKVTDGAGFLKIGDNAKIWKDGDAIYTRAARFAQGDIIELAEKLGETEQNMDRLLPQAFQRWGPDMGKAIYGDYAISVFEPSKACLDLWRDSSGVKPLFYTQLPDRRGFAFASNINALLTLPEINSAYDMTEVAKYLQSKVSYSNRSTYFEHIKILPPGRSLRWQNGALTETVFWRYDQVPKVSLTDPDQIEAAFTEHLKRAINDRLETDQIVGAHVSGGVDSTTIAVIANEHTRQSSDKPFYGYTWSPPAIDGVIEHELRMLDHVEQMSGIPIRYCGLEMDEVKQVYRRNIFRDPTNTLFSEVNILKQAQKDGVGVMLSGWGGDEIVSSNMVYYLAGLFLSGQWGKIARQTKMFTSPRGLIKVARVIKRDSVHALGLSSKAARYFISLRDRNARFAREPLRSAILSTKQRNLGFPGFRIYQHKLWEQGHIFNRISDWDQHGARFGIEYRYPLIDRRLLEFVLGLPLEAIFEYPLRGSLLRKVLAKYVGNELASSGLKREDHRQPIFQDQLAAGLQAVIDDLSSPDDLKNDWLDRKAVFDHLKSLNITNLEIEQRSETIHLLGVALSSTEITIGQEA